MKTYGVVVSARRKTERLEKQLVARSREVELLRRRLKEREMLASLGLAVSKIAHEIANPLNGMSACVQLLDRQTRDNTADRDHILEATDHLCAELGRLESLLRELRSLSRPSRHKPTAVDVAALIADVVRHCFLIRASQPVDIRSDVAEDLPPALGDPEKLKQVLFNVAKNAIEAMADGGCLTLRGFRLKQKIRLEVEDTGPGIPKGIHVFDCFATSKTNGWGLGLSIARQIIIAHHGTISYSTQLGRGTTFKISLPMC
jgi:signal transduction histidine kinase